MSSRLFTNGIAYQLDEQIPLVVLDLLESLSLDLTSRYRMILVKEGSGKIGSPVNGETHHFDSPVLICLNNQASLIVTSPVLGKEIVFHPLFLNPSYSEMDAELLWLIPFEKGKLSLYPLTVTDVMTFEMIIEKLTNSLSFQVDDYWPCRSRSYLLEALLFADRMRTRVQTPMETDEVIHSVVIYLEQHYSENITLEMLTHHFNTNRTSLSEKFKQLTGKSIIEYLVDFRIEIAKAMLRDTALTVSEVSERCGFSDQPYFNRTFRKKIGCTPNAYRKSTTWL